MSGVPTLSAERQALLASLVEKDTPIRHLHKMYGFNYSTVRRLYPDYRSSSEAQRKRFYDSDEETRALVYGMLDDGAPVSVVAKAAGVTPGHVQWLQAGAGWSKRQAGAYGGTVARLGRL